MKEEVKHAVHNIKVKNYRWKEISEILDIKLETAWKFIYQEKNEPEIKDPSNYTPLAIILAMSVALKRLLVKNPHWLSKDSGDFSRRTLRMYQQIVL
ncbi:hypothetical protein HK096_001128, partial [Nowakowskiella sp. JEL0078]